MSSASGHNFLALFSFKSTSRHGKHSVRLRAWSDKSEYPVVESLNHLVNPPREPRCDQVIVDGHTGQEII